MRRTLDGIVSTSPIHIPLPSSVLIGDDEPCAPMRRRARCLVTNSFIYSLG